jgi:hypothetical protein
MHSLKTLALTLALVLSGCTYNQVPPHRSTYDQIIWPDYATANRTLIEYQMRRAYP